MITTAKSLRIVLMRVDSILCEEIKMGLWKVSKCSGNKHIEVDVKQLKMRLQAIVKQNNTEIMQLAIESMLEELSEQQGVR